MELITSIPLSSASAEVLTPAAKFSSIRALSSTICKPLLAEDFVVQPVVDVSPPKWHLGHTTWFFENFILAPYAPFYKRYNDSFNFVFNSYYESVGKRVQRDKRGNLSRPSTSEIWNYREYVDRNMQQFLESTGSIPEEVYSILELGLNHEQQHQELLITDLKFILGNNPLHPVYSTATNEYAQEIVIETKENYLHLEEGIYDIGHSGDGFCFDNEKGRHQVFLHGFNIMDRLVTNGEYLEFIEAGGYSDFKFWLAEGWDWVCNNHIGSPMYWMQEEGEWKHYTLSGVRTVEKERPVTHISFYEADAYARWKGKRLPTEFEWEAACMKYSRKGAFANLLDTGIMEPLAATGGNYQFIGDAWEWTNSAYLAYPFYEKAEGALGEYNGKFMINQMVLRGGSCATPASHIRSTYRNFFPPDKQWQFSGIRLAEHSK